MRFLLDTNICIYVINARPAAVLARFVEHEMDGLGVSSITAAELYWGAYNSGSERNVRTMEKFLAPLEVRDFDLAAARQYGQVRTALQRKGTLIGPLDMQIAAHALAIDLTLVTNNVREFRRVPGLRVENWA